MTAQEDCYLWYIPSREEWLRQASIKMVPMLQAVGLSLDPSIAPVSVGFPNVRDGKGGKAIGVCHVKGACPEDERLRPVFISPTLGNAVMEVLPTLLHELVHAALPPEVGHRHQFAKAVADLGLAGKPTHTFLEEGSQLHADLALIAADIGPYPHVPMADRKKAKQPGWPRYRSVNEPTYKVIVSLDALAEFGPPLDPWGDPMEPCRPAAPQKIVGNKLIIGEE